MRMYLQCSLAHNAFNLRPTKASSKHRCAIRCKTPRFEKMKMRGTQALGRKVPNLIHRWRSWIYGHTLFKLKKLFSSVFCRIIGVCLGLIIEHTRVIQSEKRKFRDVDRTRKQRRVRIELNRPGLSGKSEPVLRWLGLSHRVKTKAVTRRRNAPSHRFSIFC